MTSRKWRIIAIVAAIALAVAVPPLLPLGLQTPFIFMVLAGITVTGLSLLMGYAGQVSLGQAGFFGVGALAAATTSTHAWPPLLALIAAPIAAAAVALLVGFPLLRLRGHYLAFGTLAVQIVIIALANGLPIFGTVYGIQGIPQFGIGQFELSDGVGYSYLSLILLALVLLVSYNLVNSRFGRGLRALASSESAASSAGIPVFRYKLSVFAIAGAFAGLAGGATAFVVGYISADSFPISLSIQVLVMAVVGGLGTVSGGVVGAIVITVLVQTLTAIGTAPNMPSTAPAILSYAAYAAVLILTLLFLPRGIVTSVATRVQQFRRRRPGSDQVSQT